MTGRKVVELVRRDVRLSRCELWQAIFGNGSCSVSVDLEILDSTA